jgi:hypothetical protein
MRMDCPSKLSSYRSPNQKNTLRILLSSASLLGHPPEPPDLIPAANDPAVLCSWDVPRVEHDAAHIDGEACRRLAPVHRHNLVAIRRQWRSEEEDELEDAEELAKRNHLLKPHKLQSRVHGRRVEFPPLASFGPKKLTSRKHAYGPIRAIGYIRLRGAASCCVTLRVVTKVHRL